MKNLFQIKKNISKLKKDTNIQVYQISDENAIKEVVLKVLAENEQSVKDFKAGKDRALGFLVGQAMKQTKGKANPKMLNEMFIEELKK